MDASNIRARFIKNHLDRALEQHDSTEVARTVQAFSDYVNWHADSLPGEERQKITARLSQLQQLAGDS